MPLSSGLEDSAPLTAGPPKHRTKNDLPRKIRLLVLGATIYLLIIHIWTWHLTIPFILSGRADFRQFYAAGAIVRAGEVNRLYDYETQKQFQDTLVSPQLTALPFVSPAYHALLFVPLSVFSYRTAFFLFLGFNIAALGTSYSLLRPWLQNLRVVHPCLPGGIFLGFLPVTYALIQGQDSLLLTALLSGAFTFLVRGRGFFAGLLVGLTLFKFSIVLPLVLLFLIWQRWDFLRGFAASAIPLSLLSISITGIAQTELYVSSLFAIAGLIHPISNLARYPLTLGQMANVHGLVFGLARHLAPKSGLELATIVFSFAVLAWTALKGRSANLGPKQLLLAIPCGVLVSHHTYIHDLSVLLVPIIVLLGSSLSPEVAHSRKARLISCGAWVMFIVPITESFAADHFFLVAISVGLLLVSLAAAPFSTAFVDAARRGD
jgi:Glycosyltransferase family 87